MAGRPVIATVSMGALAALLCGYAWYRTLTFDRPTGSWTVDWYDTDGKYIDTTGANRHIGSSLMHDALVLGDRLIVPTDGPERSGTRGRGGFAWISPAVGEARIAWPLETKYRVSIEGVAVRDRDTFALALRSAGGSGGGVRDHLAVAIAGRDGWLRPPEIVAEWGDLRDGGGRPLLLGMSWVDGELEVVLTHRTKDDGYGSRTPPDIVRLPVGKARVIRSHALGCTDCFVHGALPGAKGWTIISRGFKGVLLSDGAGGAVPAPPALAWWDQLLSDRTALGTLWAASGHGERRVERDGSLSEQTPPIAGWKPIASAERFEWIDGVLRLQRLWSRDGDDLTVLAHRIGARTIVAATLEEDFQLVGPSPDALRPVIYNSSSTDFRIGTFLPRQGGGYYWVDGDGDYVTLDDDLRRIDRLSLRHHLRTRGSVGDHIYEPDNEHALGWALFGLPILGLLGLVVAWTSRKRQPDGERGPLRLGALTAAFIGYVVSGGIAFLTVLAML